MANILAIARREFLASFSSPLAYAAIGVFLLFLAAFTLWLNDLFAAGVATMNGPFQWMALGLAFIAPAITMRSITEERRTGTFELLATFPVSSAEIIVGKWLAAFGVLIAALLSTLPWPIAIAACGELDVGPVLAGYLGMGLFAAAAAAIGICASSLTENATVALLGSFGACLTPWVLGWFLAAFPGAAVGFVQYLTFEYHFSNLARGTFDSRSLVFFVSVAFFALYGGVFALERRRFA